MIKGTAFLGVLLISLGISYGQLKRSAVPLVQWQPTEVLDSKLKIETRKFGAILGIQRGKYTWFEMGAEKQWKTIRLTHPPTVAATMNLEYNFKHNVLGYKIGGWMKHGRIALTYGAALDYITDFDHSRFGITPMIGLKLVGFHLVNGVNILTKSSEEFTEVNTFFISLRYFFVNKRKFSFKKKHNN